MNVRALATFLLLNLAVNADVYLHSPRGTNDRCDERSNNRNNDNRLFDSQNNAAGGYAVCGTDMKYYVDTEVMIEWTAQHGCGNGNTNKGDATNPESNSCNFVIQIGCEDVFGRYAFGDTTTEPANANLKSKDQSSSSYSSSYSLTNGMSLNKIGSSCLNTRPVSETCKNHLSLNNTQCDRLNLNNQNELNTFNSDACLCHPRKLATYGQHEPELLYKKCSIRDRNKGLFTADQNVGPKAVHTRQSPNLDRFGYECPEERDYYPYWHPTGWRDIAIQTSDTTRCPYYERESENVKGRGECVNPKDPSDPTFWQYNTESACRNQPGAAWVVSAPLWPSYKPACVQADGLRDNHLGMTSAFGESKPEPGQFSSYKWKIPRDILPSNDGSPMKCVLRVRYNISTTETKWEFTAADNGKLKTNPVIKVGDGQSSDPETALPLRFAVNTAQFGRTFQDRTEPFWILPRPGNLSTARIHNLNVRGKRGNIAQVRNCVEYDFVPNVMKVKQGDYVHFQWCGSDYNDPNNDGNGLDGTDRSNVVPVNWADANLATQMGLTDSTTGQLINTYIFSQQDLYKLAWIDQKNCFDVLNMTTNQKNNQDDVKSCHFLNGALSPYYNQLAQVTSTGTMYYVSSRNNNFSNRSQKGVIISEPVVSPVAAAGIAMGSIVFVGSAVGIFFFLKRRGLITNKNGKIFSGQSF